MTKLNPNNETETKSDILPWDIFKSNVIYFLSSISMIFEIKVSQFYEPNTKNKTKSGIFSWDIFKSDIIFEWSQNTKIFL